MLNPSDLNREVTATLRRLNNIMRVFKTDGGQLTDAGDEFTRTGIRRGLSQAELARMLEISAATASNHANS